MFLPSISLPSLFQDHMMLQRDKPLHIWGTVSDPCTLRITLGRSSVDISAENGHFDCLFPPQPAGTGLVLSFYAVTGSFAELLRTIGDICIGDIWMACGQSNMEYFLRYDANWQDTLRASRIQRNPDIRMYNCPQIAFEGQVKDTPGSGIWFEEGDPAWSVFSAPGYAFARYLQPDLQIPIGIIGCNWGGTPACAWMDEAHLQDPALTVFHEEYEQEVCGIDPEELRRTSLAAIDFENSYRHELEWRAMMYGLTWEEQQLWMQEHADDPAIPMGPYHHYRPGGLYHTMIKQIAPFSVKGFLWYQGESDSGHAELYRRTLTSLIDCFRKTWEDETLPFLFVQLAPFARWLGCTGDGYAEVRKSQQYVADTVPLTAMASIMDLGMHDDIHPKHKMEVGRRLALLARGHVYGEDILCDPPVCKRADRDAGRILLHFDYAGEGLHDDGLGTSAFCLTQGGTDLPITDFAIDGCDVILTSRQLDPALPVRIDFAQEDYCEVHLWNSAELAVRPFSLIL